MFIVKFLSKKNTNFFLFPLPPEKRIFHPARFWSDGTPSPDGGVAPMHVWCFAVALVHTKSKTWCKNRVLVLYVCLWGVRMNVFHRLVWTGIVRPALISTQTPHLWIFLIIKIISKQFLSNTVTKLNIFYKIISKQFLHILRRLYFLLQVNSSQIRCDPVWLAAHYNFPFLSGFICFCFQITKTVCSNNFSLYEICNIFSVE